MKILLNLIRQNISGYRRESDIYTLYMELKITSIGTITNIVYEPLYIKIKH